MNAARQNAIDLDRVIGIWSVELASGGNVLIFLSRTDSPATPFLLNYRFRHYVDELKSADSKDIFRFYEGELSKLTEPEALDKLREVFEAFRAHAGDGRAWELLRGARSTEEFHRLFEQMPGIYVKAVVPT